MAIKSLFKSAARAAPQATSINHEGAPAYALDSRTALAQLAATGCFGNTFYVTGEDQLRTMLEHAEKCDAWFVAKVAVYARERGLMKDMPVALLAHLSTRGPEGVAAMKAVFPRVVENGRMVRTFVQMIRSGQFGRKSLGTAPKRAVQRWLASRSAMQLFRDSVGNDPSLADVIKMVHPQPASDEARAMYGYLLGKAHDAEKLPHTVRLFDAWKRGAATEGIVPQVPSRMLAGLPLGKPEWIAIARNARWQETRMNLNTYQRHGVFDDEAMVKLIAARLADKAEVRGAKVFPYQLLTAWTMASPQVPLAIREALQDAMEHSLESIPEIEGRLVVCPDVSSSMQSPATGYRRGATSSVRCVDVAGLIAAALLRRNRFARVIPFEHEVRPVALNPCDSVMTIAQTLASIGGGGTNCSAPLALLNQEQVKVDVVIYVSDNESWVDANATTHASGGTAMMEQWMKLRARNPRAKLICIDLTPNIHKQTIDRSDILNVGGFSDAVFDIFAQFVKVDRAAHWADVVDAIEV